MTAVLIPAYQPDARLAELVAGLRAAGLPVVVVDDGSTRGADALDAVRAAGAVVLAHPANRGKGAALRTGLRWILANRPGVGGVVTADADGQHTAADILRVAEATARRRGGLVLGARTLTAAAPWRSRFGNAWTRGVFRLLTGVAVRDTQTGLRGIPADLLARVAALPGDRYEFETRMLADARRHAARPLEIPIETVYIDGNRASHYRPLRDTLRTQGALLACGLGRLFG